MTVKDRKEPEETTEAVLKHWREAVPDDRFAHLVRDAARGLTRALQYRLSQYKISFGHWVFLRILWEQDGLTQRQLSVRAGLMESTTHTAILKMANLGYVERTNPPGNNRKLAVCLTAKGRALKSKLVPLAEDVNVIATEGISDEDLETTRQTMLKIIEKLALDEAKSIGDGLRITPTRNQAIKNGIPKS
jgi:DNA-binding MarR family transcriptional regulator